MANSKSKAVVKLMGNDANSSKAATKAIVELGLTRFTLDFEKLTLAVKGDTDPTKLGNKFMMLVKADLKNYGPVKGEGKPQKPVLVKKKAVVKVGVKDAKSKKATMEVLGELDGITSYTLNLEKSKLVVIGCADPTKLVYKLRKFVKADLRTYGPEKDEGKPLQNKAVVKLRVRDAESKKAAKKAIGALDEFSSCTLDFEKSTLVVKGCADPTNLVNKVRQFVGADLLEFF